MRLSPWASKLGKKEIKRSSKTLYGKNKWGKAAQRGRKARQAAKKS